MSIILLITAGCILEQKEEISDRDTEEKFPKHEKYLIADPTPRPSMAIAITTKEVLNQNMNAYV